MPREASYLGDSVYVEIDDAGDVVLTTNNGYADDPRNRIVLDGEVLESFEWWLDAVRRKHVDGAP